MCTLLNFKHGKECGRRREKSGRISGGEDADKDEFLWQAALVYRNTRIPFCGGTLINNFYVLSAAHCLLLLSKIISPNILQPNPKPEEFVIENKFQILLNAHKLTPLTEHTEKELYGKYAQTHH